MADKINTSEIAGLGDGRDITRGYFADIMTPEDSIINTKGAGDWLIYEEMLRDDQVHSTLQQRRMALTSRDVTVEPGGTSAIDKSAAAFLEETIERLKWDDITGKMHYGIYYGFSVGEALWEQDGKYIQCADIKVRKQRRFRWKNERELVLLTRDKPMGEVMPDRKFWTLATGGDNSDNPYGIGLAHHLYWPVFFKRNGLKFWLIFLEKFGMPTVKATHPGGWDTTQKRALLEALQAVQKDSAFIVPEGTVTELLEASRSGTADYDALQKRMDGTIAKVVLSQVMTAEAVGGQYKAEIQMEVRDEVVKGDANLIHESFTDTIATWLTEWNFPGAAVPKISRDLDEDPDLNAVAERDEKIFGMGYEPLQEYIDETYGKGWIKKQATEPLAPAIDPNTVPPEFADLAAVLTGKVSQRKNQAAIVEAAKRAAGRYPDVVGARVEQILNYLDDTKDLHTFRKNLNELLEELPNEQTVDIVRNNNIVARLLGAFKGSR